MYELINEIYCIDHAHNEDIMRHVLVSTLQEQELRMVDEKHNTPTNQIYGVH